MIEFINEEIRTEFHLLPVDLQKEYNDLAIKFAATGQFILIEEVFVCGKDSEVSFRFIGYSNHLRPRSSEA